MSDSPMTLELDDPGPGDRLGAEQRRALRMSLKAARRGGEAAVLLRVVGDAWDQSPVPDADSLSAQDVAGDFHALVRDLFTLEAPVVAHFEGRVSGLGLALALACDLRTAGPDATLAVGSPGTPAALLSGVSWLLRHRAGSAVATDLVWTGRHLEAGEARTLGLLTDVSPGGSAARLLAQRLAAVPPGASSALKRSLNSRLVAELAAQLDYDSWLATVSARSAS
jgi:2-(1,2-epoxy-1,2-dihydrophenyl)acetyl-CoA isomerase